MEDSRIDALLKRALSSTETPEVELLEKVKFKLIEEEYIMRKPIMRRSISAAAITAIALMLVTTTVFAAWHLLKPSEVAERFENRALSAAFESETAININASVTSRGYTFTLLAVVSGEDITDMPYYSEEVSGGSTYAVVAIQNADGSPMPGVSEDNYGQTIFLASPLVRGLEPWRVNAFALNGGYTETVVDGVMYRIVDCDDVTMFSDRGLYFAVADVMMFSKDTFLFDEITGEIAVNPDFEGASAIFELPLDKSLANPEKAELYLKNIYSSTFR